MDVVWVTDFGSLAGVWWRFAPLIGVWRLPTLEKWVLEALKSLAGVSESSRFTTAARGAFRMGNWVRCCGVAPTGTIEQQRADKAPARQHRCD